MKKIIMSIFAAIAAAAVCAAADLQPKHRNVALQIYTFKNLTLEDALAQIKGIGFDAIEGSPEIRIGKKFPNVKMKIDMTKEQREYVKKLLKDAGLKLCGYGVVSTKTEDEVKKLCEFARDFGIKYILTEDPVSQFPVWDKYGKEYGVTMLVHHHAWNSVNQYWDPEVMRRFVSRYDNVMANPDIGHWARSSIDPVAALKTLRGEIGSIHVKDVPKIGVIEKIVVPCGEGAIDLKAVLAELDRQGYDGYLVIEHEADWDNPAPSVKKCADFFRKN